MEIISRKAWGARYAAGTGSRPIPCSETWLHHTVTKHLPVTATLEQEYAQMRVIEKIGQDRFGAGFSYNLAGFPSGRWYVGCGVRRVGNHTGGRNTRSLGIVLVGNYEANDISPELRVSLVQLLQYGHKQGWIDAPKLDGGHRDLRQTACPGAFAYRLIPSINAEAGNTAPAPQPATPITNAKGPAMIIVQEPNGSRQFLCDVDGASHISGPEREVLIAGGVPYVGEQHATDAARYEFLHKRGVTDL